MEFSLKISSIEEILMDKNKTTSEATKEFKKRFPLKSKEELMQFNDELTDLTQIESLVCTYLENTCKFWFPVCIQIVQTLLDRSYMFVFLNIVEDFSSWNWWLGTQRSPFKNHEDPLVQ